MKNDRDGGAEKAALGCSILDLECAKEIAALVEPRDYADPRHQAIQAALSGILALGDTPDTVSVRAALAASGRLEAAGGDEYLLNLTDTIPTLRNAEQYARRIRVLASARAALNAANALIHEASEGVEDWTDWLARAEGAIPRAIQDRVLATEPVHIGAAVDDMFARMVERKLKGVGWQTGFTKLDKYLGGMPAGELIVVAGRPGMGKTAFALALAMGVEKSSGLPVLFQSIEMPTAQISQRLVAMQSGVDGQKLRICDLNRDDWEDAQNAGLELAQRKLWIDDTPGVRIGDFARNLRRMKRKRGLAMGVVDYLQLMRLGERVESREREVAEMSRRLKELAKELGIPILALAQLNRETERRGDKRPQLSDLRESGSIEQDADTVLLMYRAEVYADEEDPNDKHERGTCEIIIDKQRSGPTGMVKLSYQAQCMRFANLEDWRDR